jgi:hypothetical protein
MPTAIAGVGKIESTLARRLVRGGQPAALATRREYRPSAGRSRSGCRRSGSPPPCLAPPC